MHIDHKVIDADLHKIQQQQARNREMQEGFNVHEINALKKNALFNITRNKIFFIRRTASSQMDSIHSTLSSAKALLKEAGKYGRVCRVCSDALELREHG